MIWSPGFFRFWVIRAAPHYIACVAGALFFRGFGVGGVGEEKTRRRKKSARKKREEKKREGKNKAPATILNKNKFRPHSAAKKIRHEQEVS